jgi:glyoxylase-like metal-dependent hydrolase (beta-lactamase superfamily II)
VANKVRSATLKVVAGLATVIVLAVSVSMLTLTAARLDVATVDVGALPPASPPADMSISALPTGTYDTPAIFAFRGGSWNDTRHFASTAVLVRHPKGNVLVDTGFGKNIDAHLKLIPWIQRSPHSKGVPAVDQLASGGIQPGALAGVIPTHAHWDHVSGLDDLRGVPVMVNAQGKRWIDTNAKGTEVINSFRGVNYTPYDFEDGPYLGFPRNHDVWGDGSVVIVPAPGHTPDSVVVFVNLPSGTRYAFVGDLVWQTEGLEIPAEKPWPLRRLIGEDDDEVRKDIALIRFVSKRYSQIHAIPAHDASAFRAIPVFPASAR